jgi:hypothetical protein
VTAAVSSAELETQLVNADPTKIAQDPAGFAQARQELRGRQPRRRQAQVAQQVQAGLADFARDRQARRCPPQPGRERVRRCQVLQRQGPGRGARRQVREPRRGVLPAPRRAGRPPRRRRAPRWHPQRPVLPAPAEGGFLIPEEYRAELQRIALENGVVRANGARVIPMSVPRIKFPVLDSTSNASSVHGGIIAYWGEEGAALTASSPQFATVALDVHKLTGYTEIPNELLADSQPSVGPLVDELFPQGLAYFEDVAFISGSGVGQPLGFLNADARSPSRRSPARRRTRCCGRTSSRCTPACCPPRSARPSGS